MDIRDRLEFSYKERQSRAGDSSRNARRNAEKENQPRESDISKYVTGSYVPTSSGEIFLARHTYDIDHLHGDYVVGSIEELKGKNLKILSPTGSEISFDHRKVLFLDTETTGLAGGSGTAAFLIGLGYFLENKFIVEQLFMRDYDEEAPMLNLLAEKAREFDQIVTFNGRSFDLPLLETRMILNRIEPALSRLRDIDLLHPARRIWGLSLSDCRLGTLEEEILGFERTEDDIPGSLIPGLYFDYIRFGNVDPLYKVFYHNEKDVLSMIGILHKEFSYLSNPLNEKSAKPLDLYNMGKYFERMRDWTTAIACIQKASPGLNESYRRDSLIRLSMIHKKEERWEEAVGIWKDLVHENNRFHLLPYVELAKYYEHREKKLETALDFAKDALNNLSKRRVAEIEHVKHRIARLERRLGIDGI